MIYMPLLRSLDVFSLGRFSRRVAPTELKPFEYGGSINVLRLTALFDRGAEAAPTFAECRRHDMFIVSQELKFESSVRSDMFIRSGRR